MKMGKLLFIKKEKNWLMSLRNRSHSLPEAGEPASGKLC